MSVDAVAAELPTRRQCLSQQRIGRIVPAESREGASHGLPQGGLHLGLT